MYICMQQTDTSPFSLPYLYQICPWALLIEKPTAGQEWSLNFLSVPLTLGVCELPADALFIT